MGVIQKFDWDKADFNKIVGDYITLPNGTEHYIEMDLLHWYWLEFMSRKGQSSQSVAQHAFDVMNEIPDAEFDELFRVGIMSYGREWVRLTEGR